VVKGLLIIRVITGYTPHFTHERVFDSSWPYDVGSNEVRSMKILAGIDRPGMENE
jgi:hypothetical protein